MLPVETTSLAAIADRASRLFSPPAVALEVLRLTEDATIDGRALCDCLQRDPALAAKLLRVVNSSLYGLPRRVGSLPQAVALLGVQPLKLLVLGFSIPEGLTAGVTATGKAMQQYWTTTLTTAAAARCFAEAGWGRLGDEALVAGLMQGVGQLVLFEQFGEGYATLVNGATRCDASRTLAELEREAFGFEYRGLSAELVRRWRLPEAFPVAIERQVDDAALDDLPGDDACLAQSLRLGNLLSRLLLQRDLGALPQLLALSERDANLTHRQINQVVDAVGVESRELAEALAAPLVAGWDHQQTMQEAHARLSLLAEQGAVRMMGEPRSTTEIEEDERLCRELLLETRRLSAALRTMLVGGLEPRTDAPHHDSTPPWAAASAPLRQHSTRPWEWLVDRTSRAIEASRETRSGVVLSIVEVSCEEAAVAVEVLPLREWIDASPWTKELAEAVWAPTARNRAVVWMTGIDRIEASRMWTEVGTALARSTTMQLNVGVAGVAHPTQGFSSERMLDAAERCLTAALAHTGPTVKSIEVF